MNHIELQNHRMARVQRDLKDPLVPASQALGSVAPQNLFFFFEKKCQKSTCFLFLFYQFLTHLCWLCTSFNSYLGTAQNEDDGVTDYSLKFRSDKSVFGSSSSPHSFFHFSKSIYLFFHQFYSYIYCFYKLFEAAWASFHWRICSELFRIPGWTIANEAGTYVFLQVGRWHWISEMHWSATGYYCHQGSLFGIRQDLTVHKHTWIYSVFHPEGCWDECAH